MKSDDDKRIQGPGLSFDQAIRAQDAAEAHRIIENEVKCPYCNAVKTLHLMAKALVATQGHIYDLYTSSCNMCSSPPFQVYVDVTERDGMAKVAAECLKLARKQGDEKAIITLSQMSLPGRR